MADPADRTKPFTAPSGKAGHIPMADGNVFCWMMTGTSIPEVCGWVEKDWVIVKGTYGYWRTPDPEEAVKRASTHLDIGLKD